MWPVLLAVLAILLGITGIVLSIDNKEKFGGLGAPIFAICMGIFDLILLSVLMTTLTAFIIVFVLAFICLVLIK